MKAIAFFDYFLLKQEDMAVFFKIKPVVTGF